MKHYLRALFFLLFFSAVVFAREEMDDVSKLAKRLNLYGGEKATVQWKRVFSSIRHLKRYKLDTLDSSTRVRLEHYLIQHAADSEQPIVPGL